jgi:F-type H+-transporting ATPase subunit gamma
MATIRVIKTRIKAVGTIKKIANALEVVSLTRLRRIEAMTLQAKAYFDTIRELVGSVSEHLVYEAHPLLRPRKEVKKIGLIIITSDKGLCGSFNANIYREINTLQSNYPRHGVEFIAIGRKGATFTKRKGWRITKEYFSTLKDHDYIQSAAEISAYAAQAFLAKDIDEFHILFNEFRQHLLGKARLLKLLPLKVEGFTVKRVRDYIYEPSPYRVLDRMLQEYLSNQIAQAILESGAAEEMARMVAMKQACDSADEAIEKMSLQYHKARQAQITKELVEIATAAEVA